MKGRSMFEHFDNPRDLLEFRLGTAVTMEHDSLSMLGDLEQAAQSEDIKQMFRHHADETRHQITNLSLIFDELGISAADQPSPVTKGLAKEGTSLVRKSDPALLDGIVLSAALETEHAEIAAYQSLVCAAESLGLTQAARLLSENLGEEEHTSRELLDRLRKVSAAA
jgi:ferritin-like metal-binding protein YciE